MPVLKIKKADGTWQEVWGATSGASGGASTPKLTNITMLADAWEGSEAPYSQIVSCNGVKANSKLDLQPAPEQLLELQDAEISLMMVNDNRTAIVYAFGDKPQNNFEMQVLITEVAGSMSVIYGNIVGGGASSLKTLVLVDEDGNEMTGIVVDELTLFTAVDSDVKLGKVYAGDQGVSTGTHVCD